MTLDLDAIRERAEAATPGPWRRETESDFDEYSGRGCSYTTGVSAPVSDSVSSWLWVVRFDDDYGTDQHADGEFIAHARTDVPALLSEVERLKGALSAVVGVLSDAAADVEGWRREAMAILADPVYNPVVAEVEIRHRERGCQWCGCIGFHSEVCKGFEVNDPGRVVS